MRQMREQFFDMCKNALRDKKSTCPADDHSKYKKRTQNTCTASHIQRISGYATCLPFSSTLLFLVFFEKRLTALFERKKMRTLILLVFVFGAVCVDASVLSKLFQLRGKLFGYAPWEETSVVVKRDASAKSPKASCGAYNREMAVDCFHYLADKNCDHALDRAEVQNTPATGRRIL